MNLSQEKDIKIMHAEKDTPMSNTNLNKGN